MSMFMARILVASAGVAGACLNTTAWGEPAGLAPAVALPAAGAETETRSEVKRAPSVAYLEIDATPIERPGPFDWLSSDGASPTILDLVNAFDRAAEDDTVDGVVVRLKSAPMGLYHVEELGEAMARVREAGKKIHVFSEAFGTSELLFGAHADDVLAQTGGPVSLPGLYSESMYFRDMFDWVGITPDFVQIGDYKGANEAYMNEEPSDEWEQNISGLLDQIYGQMRETLKDGRDMSDRRLDRAMEDAWYTQAEDAERLGLIDSALDLDDLAGYVQDAYGSDVEWRKDFVEVSGGLDFDSSNPFAIFSLLASEPDFGPDGPTIAVVHIDGPIMDGESSPGGLFGSESVGSTTIRRVINDIADEDDIKGVVIRINSPGGSATASEVIWQGFRRLAEEKPVWVSVGSMAASGGYYIAVSGNKIYVNPSSIVGSIGVVGGKLAMGGVYENLHLNVVTRARGPRAGMFGSVDPWTHEQRRAVRVTMEDTYDLFTERVTQGRPHIELDKTAEGRLFAGHMAVELDMADKVGGLDIAVADLAGELGMEQYDVLHYPGPQDLESLFEQAFGVMAPGATAGESHRQQLSRALLGVAAEAISPQLREQVMQTIDAAVMLRSEPVMLLQLNPFVIR